MLLGLTATPLLSCKALCDIQRCTLHVHNANSLQPAKPIDMANALFGSLRVVSNNVSQQRLEDFRCICSIEVFETLNRRSSRCVPVFVWLSCSGKRGSITHALKCRRGLGIDH